MPCVLHYFSNKLHHSHIKLFKILSGRELRLCLFMITLSLLNQTILNKSVMIGKYKIITLCGSTKFKDEFISEQKRLTLEGNIVISVGLFGHGGDEEVWLEKTKIMLDDMHKRKIDLADEIFVINVKGYIGSSTRSEIDYALKINKPVKYLEPV
jgi:hypothetical protein